MTRIPDIASECYARGNYFKFLVKKLINTLSRVLPVTYINDVDSKLINLRRRRQSRVAPIVLAAGGALLLSGIATAFNTADLQIFKSNVYQKFKAIDITIEGIHSNLDRLNIIIPALASEINNREEFNNLQHVETRAHLMFLPMI